MYRSSPVTRIPNIEDAEEEEVWYLLIAGMLFSRRSAMGSESAAPHRVD